MGATGLPRSGITALLLGFATTTASAQDARPVDRTPQPVHNTHVGLGVPLPPAERIEYFQNGCGVIVSKFIPEYELSWIRQRNWYGGCRFGLAHGPGVIANKDYWTDRNLPVSYHYGYPKSYQWSGKFSAYGKERSDNFNSRWDAGGNSDSTKIWSFNNSSTVNIPNKAYHLWLPRDNGYDHFAFNEVQIECSNVLPTLKAESAKRLTPAHVATFVAWCKESADPHSTVHKYWSARVHFLYRTYERTDLEGKPTSAGALKNEPAYQAFRCNFRTLTGCTQKEWAAMTGKLTAELARQVSILEQDSALPQSMLDAIAARFAPLEERRETLRKQLSLSSAAGTTAQTGDTK